MDNPINTPSSSKWALALRAASRVLRHPGSLGNPLLFVGGDAEMKTSLLKRMARRAKRRGWKIFYSNVRDFSRKFRHAIRARLLDRLEAELKDVKLFILDGIERLSGCRHTQQFLLNLWGGLSLAGCQMIFSGSLMPSQLSGFDPKAASQIESGFVLELHEATATKTLDHVAQSVAEKFNVPVDVLYRSSSHRAAFARAAFIALAFDSGFSSAEIAQSVGGKSRAALQYAQKKTQNLCAQDSEFRVLYDTLRDRNASRRSSERDNRWSLAWDKDV